MYFKIKIKYFVYLFVALVVGVALASCQNSSNLEFKNHIKIGIEQKIKNLNPLKATAALDMRLGGLIFSSLVKLDKTLTVVGDLAESWSYKNSVYTFVLKKNIFFSNGRELRKEDIIFSFKSFKDPKCIFHHAFSVIKSVLVEKNLKNQKFLVKLFLKKSSAKFLRADLPVLKILPKKEFLQNKDGFNQLPIGTGPYYVNKVKPYSIELKPNPHFLQSKQSGQSGQSGPSKQSKQSGQSGQSKQSGPSKKMALLFKVVSDNTTRYQKLLKQDIDISFNNTEIIKVNALQKNSDFKIYTSPGLSVVYLLLNLKHPLLSQINIRKAIKNSLNIKKIIQYKLKGFASPASSLLNPQHLFFNTDLKYSGFNLKKAKSFLQKIQLSSLSLKVSNKPSSINFGKILSQQIKQSGINIKLKSLEWGILYKDLKNSNFDIALMSWSGVIDPDIYRIAFHSSEWPPGRNRSLYKNLKLDKLLEKGIYTLNLKQRKKIYNKVQKIISQDIAIIPLWHKKQIIVSHKNVLGLTPYLTESFSPLINAYKKK